MRSKIANMTCVMPVPPEAPTPPGSHDNYGTPSDRAAYRRPNGDLLGYVFRFDHPGGGKTILPLTLWRTEDGQLRWEWKQWPDPRPLLNLPGLAQLPQKPVLVIEGEKTARAAHRLLPEYAVTTSPGGSNSAEKADWSPLAGRDVVIWPDADGAGAHYAEVVSALALRAGAKSVRVVDITGLPQKWDLADAPPADLNINERIAAAREVLGGALGVSQANEVGETVRNLASLPAIEYDLKRKAIAKQLGIRVDILDDAVEQARTKFAGSEASFPAPDPAPWPHPVEGAALLNEIVAFIKRFIVARNETIVAAALWVVMTWLIDDVEVAPLAVITAPEKRCGKSQFLTVLAKLARRPLATSNITSAALFRVIEAWNPTLIIDEADTFMRDNEALRGVLNSGHTRPSAYVLRTVGDDHTPKQFSTWGAKAISGIGLLPATLMDRAIVLPLRRKLPHETVERLRHCDHAEVAALVARIRRFTDDCRAAIKRARPKLPHELNDRAQDNWEPLLAIADCAGGAWPDMARRTALALNAEDDGPSSIGGELLADVREVFEASNTMRLSSSSLLASLITDDEGPWQTYDKGRPMKPRQLSKLLAGYGIKATTQRTGATTAKCYDRDQFDDAFKRYLK